MLVKICGITRSEDARAAIEHGAGAIGFIMWPDSPRSIDVERVRAIVAQLPDDILKVGVFVNQDADQVNAAAERAGLSHVQLHGDEDATFAASLARPVIKATSDLSANATRGWDDDTTFLVDAHDPVRRGGTGRTVDWTAAAAFAQTRRVMLAGGLTPENVAAAIEAVHPFGIDVSSGVEAAPGIKSRERIRQLFEAIGRAGRRDGDLE